MFFALACVRAGQSHWSASPIRLVTDRKEGTANQHNVTDKHGVSPADPVWEVRCGDESTARRSMVSVRSAVARRQKTYQTPPTV